MHGRVIRGISKAAYPVPYLFLVVLSSPAPAQPVTLSDLEGLTIEADVHREQNVRRQGRAASVRVHQSWRFSIGPDKVVENTINTTMRTPHGTQTEEPAFNKFTLEQPKKIWSRGGGEAVWKFADETLTFVRTFPSGAYRIAFAFARTPSGLTCTVTDAFAREGGKGEIKMQSAFGGGEVTIISARQLPSTCKVGKQR
jgi:hypothetical protein